MHIKFYYTHSLTVCQTQREWSLFLPIQQAGIHTDTEWRTLGNQWGGVVGTLSNMEHCVTRYSPLAVDRTAYMQLFTIQSSGRGIRKH